MQIAICEDEWDTIQKIQKQIQIFCSSKNMTARMDGFTCGKDLLGSSNEYDFIFMDIYLRDCIGTDVVRSLSTDFSSQIVFTTSSIEYAVEAFEMNAVHYLLKPITQTDVNEAMERCLLRVKQQPRQMLEIKVRQSIISVPIDNIMYIEVFNKISVIHTAVGEYKTYATLDSLFERLNSESFIRAQRSFIVNMNFIESFLFDRLIIQGGTEVMLSRNNRSKLKNKYQQFLSLPVRGTQI